MIIENNNILNNDNNNQYTIARINDERKAQAQVFHRGSHATPPSQLYRP